MSKQKTNDLEALVNFFGTSALTYVMGLAFVSQVRETAKAWPMLKPKIIEALELLIQELKQKP